MATLDPNAQTTVSPTITPPGGYNVNTQQLDSLNKLLTSLAPSAPQSSISDMSQIANVQSQAPAYMRTAASSLIDQSGIPNLQAGSSNLSQIFDLMQHHENLAQAQTSPGLLAGPVAVPTAVDYSGVGSIDKLLAPLISQPTASGGFGGFTTPSLALSSGAVVPQSASSLIDMINQAVSGQQQNVVQPALTTASENYQNLLNTLQMGMQLRQSTQPTLSEKISMAQNGLIYDPTTGNVSPDTSGFTDLGSNMSTGDQLDHLDQMIAQHFNNPTLVDKYEKLKAAIIKNAGGTMLSKDEQSKINNSLNDYLNTWNNMGLTDKLNPGNPNNVKLRNEQLGLVATLRKALVGGRITQQEINLITSMLPPINDPTKVLMFQASGNAGAQAQIDQIKSQWLSDVNPNMGSSSDGSSTDTSGGWEVVQ